MMRVATWRSVSFLDPNHLEGISLFSTGDRGSEQEQMRDFRETSTETGWIWHFDNFLNLL